MRDHRAEFRLATMCRVLKVERSGFYAWLKQPQSTRAREDERLLVMIEEAYLQSGGVYVRATCIATSPKPASDSAASVSSD